MAEHLCIFFQAPAELPYVIQLYDEYKDKANVKIVVVNVYSNYEFIKSLNLSGARVVFCERPCKGEKIMYSIIPIRKTLNKFWNTNLASIITGDVFFFSTSFDWITAFFVKRFCTNKDVVIHYAGFNTTEILLRDAYKEGNINKGLGIKDCIHLLLMKLITGIWFDYYKKLRCISFPYFKYGIEHKYIQLRLDCIEPYKIEIPSKVDNNILLFTTTWGYEGEDIKFHVDNRICEIIKKIQDMGYKVVVKGHPRLGVSGCIEKIADYVLPNYVPAEFISVSKVKMIIGLNSAAIIHYAKYTNVEVVSLLKMLDGISQKLVEDNINLMHSMCGEKIIIPNSFQELCSRSML